MATPILVGDSLMFGSLCPRDRGVCVGQDHRTLRTRSRVGRGGRPSSGGGKRWHSPPHPLSARLGGSSGTQSYCLILKIHSGLTSGCKEQIERGAEGSTGSQNVGWGHHPGGKAWAGGRGWGWRSQRPLIWSGSLAPPAAPTPAPRDNMLQPRGSHPEGGVWWCLSPRLFHPRR